MRRAGLTVALATLAAFGFGASGCSPVDRGPRFQAAGATSPRDGGTFRFALNGQLRTLDPTIAYDDVASYLLHPLFDTLVDFSPHGFDVAPRLAARWTISADGLRYTFELRPGIAFSDGEPITAAHVKYGLERALATADSPFSRFLIDIDGAEAMIAGAVAACAGIIALDDRRLAIQLVRRNPALLGILSMSFATPQRPSHVAAAGAQLRRRPDATGPFVLASWDEGHRAVLRRNPHYHDAARVHLDEIVVLENIPRDTQFQMFERGELESIDTLAAPDFLYVMTAPAWQPYLHRAVGMSAFGSRINTAMKPLDDRRVRQALNYALDKRHTARLLHGTTVPSHGILPPGMFGRATDLAPYPHDVARARALLAEAGYPDGFDVEYLTPSDEETENVVGSLQSDLAQVGIRVHVTVTTWATYATAIGKPGGSALSLGSWLGDFPDPSNFFEALFHSRAIRPADSTNNTFYANPELDALLDAARQELDPGRREAMYQRAERILHDDAPWIWDYHRVTAEVVQPYVRNYTRHPIWLRDYTSVWLDLGADGAPVPR